MPGTRQFLPLGNIANPTTVTWFPISHHWGGNNDTAARANHQFVAPVDLTFTAIHLVISKTVTGTIALTVRDDGMATACTVAVVDPVADALNSTTDLSVEVAAGSVIDVSWAPTDISASEVLNMDWVALIEFETPDGDTFITMNSGEDFDNGDEFPASGAIYAQTLTFAQRNKIPINCTLESAKIIMADDLGAGNAVTVTLFKNGTTTGESVVLSETAEGTVVDWDDIGVGFEVGDTIHFDWVHSGGTPGANKFGSISCAWTPETTGAWWLGAHTPDDLPTNATEYHPVAAGDEGTVWTATVTRYHGLIGRTAGGYKLTAVSAQLETAPGTSHDIDLYDIVGAAKIADLAAFTHPATTSDVTDLDVDFADGEYYLLRAIAPLSAVQGGLGISYGFLDEEATSAGNGGGLYGGITVPFVPKQGGTPSTEPEPGPPWGPPSQIIRHGGAVADGAAEGTDRITSPNEDPGVPRFTRNGGAVS